MDAFVALSDPTRRRIVELLANWGELSATEIASHFPVSPQAISQHLKVLREAQLVQVERRAQQRIYRIDPQGMLELEQWAKQLGQIWSRRFDALAEALESEKKQANGEAN